MKRIRVEISAQELEKLGKDNPEELLAEVITRFLHERKRSQKKHKKGKNEKFETVKNP